MLLVTDDGHELLSTYHSMTSSSSARPERLISLDDPAAPRAEATGGKAAALARARQAGLPALAGSVAPIREGAAALRAGCAALREAGRSAARRPCSRRRSTRNWSPGWPGP